MLVSQKTRLVRIPTSSATTVDAFPADGAVTMTMTVVTGQTRSTVSHAAALRVSLNAPMVDASRTYSTVTDSATARMEATK